MNSRDDVDDSTKQELGTANGAGFIRLSGFTD